MIEAPERTSLDLHERVHICLEGLLRSTSFSGSPRLSQFLRHIVINTLDGELAELKEVSIGMAVFGKAPSYDPKEEPIVRVEARRLRARLEEYYAKGGVGDPIRICLPKGGYQVQFQELCSTPVVLETSAPKMNTRVRPTGTSDPLGVSPSLGHSIQEKRYGSRAQAGRLVVLLAFLAGVGTVLLSTLGRPKPLRFSKVVPLASYPGNELQPSISHDGKEVSFVWSGGKGDNYDIYVKLLDIGSAVRLTTDPAHDLSPRWSPDDRYLAFLRVSQNQRGVFVIPALGGEERKVADLHMESPWKDDALQVRLGLGPAWSLDGRALLVADQVPGGSSAMALYWLALDGSAPRRITSPPALGHDFNAVVAHRHEKIAFVRETSNSSGDLFVCDSDGNQLRQITFDRRRIEGIAFSADDQYLVFTSNRGGADELWQIPANGGVAERIAAKGDQVGFPDISDDGSLLAYTATTQNSNIWRLQLGPDGHSSAKPELFIASSEANDSPRYSPDGKSIAFVSNRLGSWEIWVCDSEGNNPRKLTNFGGPMVGTPHWSPDSRFIVFDSRPRGRSIIYIVDVRGGTPQQAIDDGFEDKKPNWSRDGKSLYYTSNRDGASQLWRSGIHGEHPIRLTTMECNDSVESSDGKTIYFQNDDHGINRMPVTGGKPEAIEPLRHVYPSRYFDVTDKVYAVDQENLPRTIREWDPRTGNESSVGAIDGQLVYGTPSLSVSPDRRYILFAQQDKGSSRIITLRR